MQLADIRKDYTNHVLDEHSVLSAPIAQFEQWMAEAIAAELPEPTAMILSTVGSNSRPSGRVVLLKGIDDGSFVFYTNYGSRKGQQMDFNPYASLTFHWVALERQVRIEGTIQQVSPEISDAYFWSRPRASQLGAHVSPQSQVIAGREVLEERYAAVAAQFADNEVIPRPANWGGYALLPDSVEFWQGRPSRLHDRVLYTLQPNHAWHICRLAP